MAIILSEENSVLTNLLIFQSFSSGIAFFYSQHLTLQWQLLILVVTAIVGAWAFLLVEWDNSKNRDNVDKISINGPMCDSISDCQEESLVSS